MPTILYVFPPDELPQSPTVLRADEDYWQSPVAPTLFSFLAPAPWQFEQGEDASNLQTALDHSDFAVFVSPVFIYTIPQVYAADDVFVSSPPTFGTDEDFWRCLPAPVASSPAPRVFADDEVFPITLPIQDEDFWTSGATPLFTWPVPLLVTADDVLFPQAPMRDEDDWTNAVAPVAAQNFLALPYLPDAEEIPAGSLFVSLPPSVSGIGQITAVSGAGSVATDVGAGSVSGEVSGSGQIN